MGINKIYAIMKEMKENAGLSDNKKLTPYRYSVYRKDLIFSSAFSLILGIFFLKKRK